MSSNRRFTGIRGIALASACLFLAAEEPAALGIKDSGKTSQVKAGGAVVVRLAAQLGTGYRWHLKAPPAAVLAQDGEEKIEPIAEGDKQMPGAAELQVFRFIAKAPGKADLKFEYFREFEPGKKPTRTATFHIQVVAEGK